MSTEYPSGNQERDDVIELLCDEWPTHLVWLEWNERSQVVCRLLDLLDQNRLRLPLPPTGPVPPPATLYPGVPTIDMSEQATLPQPGKPTMNLLHPERRGLFDGIVHLFSKRNTPK